MKFVHYFIFSVVVGLVLGTYISIFFFLDYSPRVMQYEAVKRHCAIWNEDGNFEWKEQN